MARSVAAPLRRAVHRVHAGRDARPGEAVVLMYHRVASVGPDPWRLSVSPAHFDQHVAAIAQRFRPLALDELIRGLRGNGVPRRSVVVTFDDGYRDNLKAAKPVLERHGVPATIFVATGYVGAASFWWDDLEELANRAGMSRDELRTTWRKLRAGRHEERLARRHALLPAAGRPPDRAPLAAAELASLAESGLVTIGAHTVTHPALPDLEQDEQLAELVGSKAFLEELLGRPVASASYPHGAYNRTTLACARRAGFRGACATGGRAVTRRTSALEIPRIHALDVPGDELAHLLEQRLR